MGVTVAFDGTNITNCESGDDPSWIDIKGMESIEYCSKILFPAGSKYRVAAFTKLKDPGHPAPSYAKLGLRLRKLSYTKRHVFLVGFLDFRILHLRLLPIENYMLQFHP